MGAFVARASTWRILASISALCGLLALSANAAGIFGEVHDSIHYTAELIMLAGWLGGFICLLYLVVRICQLFSRERQIIHIDQTGIIAPRPFLFPAQIAWNEVDRLFENGGIGDSGSAIQVTDWTRKVVEYRHFQTAKQAQCQNQQNQSVSRRI